MVGDMPLFRWSTCILIAATLLQSGCTLLTVAKVAATPVGLAGEVVKQTGKVAGKSVVVGGKVAGSAVAGAGRVAVCGTGAGTRVAAASLDAGGSLSAASIRALSQMAAAGMVTFVDVSTGSVTRVPWRAGLNVYGSGALARIQVAERALAVVRGGQLVYRTAKAMAAARALPVQPGDVIRLADYIG